MSLNLSFGANDPDDPGAAAARRALDAALAAHGLPPHTEPPVPLQAWSFKRRVVPLLDGAAAVGGPWPVLDHTGWNDAVFLPRSLAQGLVAPDGLTVAGLPELCAELARLDAGLARRGLDLEHPQREALAQLQAAAGRALAAGCALWLG